MSVLVHRTMSLDGFIAGPNHEMDWIFGGYPRPRWAEEVMRATGAIVSGRGAYGVNERAESGPTSRPYGGAWSGPVFMATHQQFDDLPDWIEPIGGDIRDIIATAQAAAGGKTVEVHGGNLAAQCFAAGLVTDVIVYVLPIILGDGIAFSAGSGRVDLELVDSAIEGGVAALHYRVAERCATPIDVSAIP
jgi:dihydrofolate reductase